MFADIISMTEESLTYWNQIVKFVHDARGPDHETFDFTVPVPQVEMLFEELSARVYAAVKSVESVKSVDLKSEKILLPKKTIDEFEQSMKKLHKKLGEFVGFFEDVDDNSFETLDVEGWSVTGGSSGETIEIGELHEPLDEVIANYCQIVQIIKAPKLNIFAESVATMSSYREEALANMEETQSANTRANRSIKKIMTQHSKAGDFLEKISSIHESASDVQSKATTTLDEVNTLNQQIESDKQEASDIADQLKNCKVEADKFDSFIEENKSKIENWNVKANSHHNRMNAQKREIEKVIDRSDKMLSQATTAGLSTVFEKTHSEFDRELEVARRSFQRAIGRIVLVALPYLFYVLTTKLSDTIFLAQSIEENADSFFTILSGAEVFSGITIVIFLVTVPLIWAARFAAARHEKIFKLREHYKYKYSLAMSVEGFKKQAPKYEDQIAAITFSHLLLYPEDNIIGGPESSSHPNKYLISFMNLFGMNASGK